MLIGSRQRLQAQNNQHVEIQVEGKIIKQVEETKSLGVYIDNNLSWKKHVDETSKKVYCGIGALKRLKPFISTDYAIKIYRSLIQPHFEYCSAVWDGISGHLSQKLQKLQNRAARAITKSNNETSSSLLRNALGWENLSTIRKRQKAIMMFKTIHKFSPKYLQDLFIERSTNKLQLSKPRTDYLKRSFEYSGAVLWNDLPESLKSSCSSLGVFKKKHKSHFSSLGSHTAIM